MGGGGMVCRVETNLHTGLLHLQPALYILPRVENPRVISGTWWHDDSLHLTESALGPPSKECNGHDDEEEIKAV